MLNTSNYGIVLTKSSLYLRISSLIYASSLIVLINSNYPLLLKLLTGVCLLILLLKVLNNPRPYSEDLRLQSCNEGWLLQEQNKQETRFEKARVVIDINLFLLLELSTGVKRKYLVIFSDQLSKENYRLLNILAKIK